MKLDLKRNDLMGKQKEHNERFVSVKVFFPTCMEHETVKRSLKVCCAPFIRVDAPDDIKKVSFSGPFNNLN